MEPTAICTLMLLQIDMNNLLSVVVATRNESENIERCLRSVLNIADEIIVFDEYSDDKTREIAKKLGAKVFLERHHDIFHITKQKALKKAKCKWVLQLDADEVVTPELGEEITKIINMKDSDMDSRKISDSKKAKLFENHTKILVNRDGKVGKTEGPVSGFFVARKNIFLGKPLIHAGVYPDGVIRLVRNGFASFPQKSVHEQIQIEGRVSWLENDLEHYDSPTFSRYLDRANRYTDLTAAEFLDKNVSRGFLTFTYYVFFKPFLVFVSLFFVHKGIFDGAQGFIWSFFSALHYPLAYSKYLTNSK